MDESNLRNMSSHSAGRPCRRPLEPSRVFLQPSRYDPVFDVREIERRERQLRLEKAVTGSAFSRGPAAQKKSSGRGSQEAASRAAAESSSSSSRARVEMVGSLLSSKEPREAAASSAVANFTPDSHGVWLAEFGAGGRFLASVDAARPRVLYVWDLAGGPEAARNSSKSCRAPSARLVRGVSLGALLVQLRDVECARWEPASGERLAVASNSSRFALWSPSAGARSINVPHPGVYSLFSCIRH